MKKIFVILLILLVSLSIFAAGNEESSSSIKIGVSKITTHPALDAVETAMQDYLATTDLDIVYNFQNANGDPSTAASIAKNFENKSDIVLGIGTPTAQALVNVFDDIPVLFSAVTDPVDAGLVADNVAGVSDANPVEAQIKLLIDITGAKTIGNVYSSGEANGVILMESAKAACEKYGVEFVEVAISNSAEVKQAAQSIAPRVDAIYVATDNAVCSALPALDDVCVSYNIPYFAADPTSSEGLNYLITWGFNYYSLGLETGKLIEKIAKGENPKSIGTIYLTDPAAFELWINLDVANTLGIEISQEHQDMAAKLIKNGEVL